MLKKYQVYIYVVVPRVWALSQRNMIHTCTYMYKTFQGHVIVKQYLMCMREHCRYTTTRNVITNDYCLFLQRVVTGVLNGTIREWSMKDTQVMVAIIGLLAGELDPGSQHVRTNDDLSYVLLCQSFCYASMCVVGSSI